MSDRTALIALATQIDEARKAANAIEATAPQHGVYGSLADALRKTINLIVGGDEAADDVYDAIVMDGTTVEQALEYVARQTREGF